MNDRQLTTQGAERKQQLLDAAARLFAEQGYAATRVVDIVEAAGVAKGLFYWYFENKEALFRELATEIRQRLRRQQAAAMDDDAPALVRILQATVASVRVHGRERAVLLAARGRGPQRVRRAAPGHRAAPPRRVRCSSSTASADGTVTQDEPAELLALAVVGTVGQFSHFHRTGRIDLSLAELSGYVARLVARMLTSDENVARTSLLALAPALLGAHQPSDARLRGRPV